MGVLWRKDERSGWVVGRWRGRGLEWSGGRLIGRQYVCSMGSVSWDVGEEGWKGAFTMR